MNNFLDTITSDDGGPIAQLAGQFGLSPEQVRSAIGQLAPALTGAVQQNAAKPGGMDALQRAVTSGNHTRYLDDPATLADPATTEDGNAILGHLLGSKDESRRVAGASALATGISPDILKQMLPLVAALVMGQLGKSSSGGGGGLGSILGGLAGGAGGMGSLGGGASSGSGGGLLGGILGKLLGRR